MLMGLSVTLASCATVFGGPRTAYQTIKPQLGQPQREVRVGAMVADFLLCPPCLGIDFATGAIYKPAPTGNVTPASK
jgi:hypothetical protein